MPGECARANDAIVVADIARIRVTDVPLRADTKIAYVCQYALSLRSSAAARILYNPRLPATLLGLAIATVHLVEELADP